MKAFTSLCSKINISVMGQTITIYPKVGYESDFENFISLQEVNYWMGAPALNIKHFIKHNDAKHELYHQDGLNRKEEHYHIELNDPIDQAIFNEILHALLYDDLITDAEMLCINHAYNKANLLEENVSIASSPAASSPAASSPARAENSSPVSTSSFKTGFFQLASMIQRSVARISSQPFMPKY